VLVNQYHFMVVRGTDCITKVFAEKISTRVKVRPELDKAVALARDVRSSGAAVTIVVHEHKRLGRGIDLAALAEQLRADGIGLEFLKGELQGSHDPSGVVFAVLAALAESEREYIRDRTLKPQGRPRPGQGDRRRHRHRRRDAHRRRPTSVTRT
jgi:DNA invertase Pin-like site-specific DNA recombinase